MEQQDRDARYEEYCNTYEQQLTLNRYITSLNKDIENLHDVLQSATKGARRIKKLIKINERDVIKYKKMLETLPPLPPFK